MNLLVAGAGPAGLAAALGFAKLGYTVDILEKHKEFAVRGSTLGLQENGVTALREFLPAENVDSLLDRGIRLTSDDDDDDQSAGMTLLAWWSLHGWLLEQVEECSAIHVHMGNTLDCITNDETADCITVQCKEGTMFQGDALVAADGVHSKVRSLLGLSECEFTGNTIWRGSVVVEENDTLLQDLLEQKWSPVPYENYGGHTAFFVFNHHPKLPRRLNWIVNSRATTIEQDKTTPWDLIEPHTRHDGMRNVIKAILDQSKPQELTHSMKLSTIELPDASNDGGWGGRGRVTLIGDAAHACRPTAGQGTSLAFEDVAVLCRKLKNNRPVSRDEWESTIREFENERLGRVKRIADEQVRLANAMANGDMSGSDEEYTNWVAKGA